MSHMVACAKCGELIELGVYPADLLTETRRHTVNHELDYIEIAHVECPHEELRRAIQHNDAEYRRRHGR